MDLSVSIKELSVSYGSVKVLESMSIDIKKGEFVVLLGPSGCGKSTLLNCIAGLLDTTDGQIFINDRNVTWEEPKDRGIGMVFQSYALYPQMTVERNLSFGLRVTGHDKADIEARVKKTAETLQIEPLLDRKPGQLSGGQRQRVAIGRALVRDVEVFLFDEPLSNLDAKLRSDLRVEIKRLHQRLDNTMIYVTHDQVEAMTLADRIAIMKDGVIQQFDAPAAIYNNPVNLFVAGFIGSPSMNFLNGTLEGGTTPKFTFGGSTISVKGYNFKSKPGKDVKQKVVMGVRPEQIMLDNEAKGMPFTCAAEIEIVEPMGSETLVWTSIEGHPVTFRCAASVELVAGQKVTLGFDPATTSMFDDASGDRI